ncbi:hypothetical protein STENM327S_01780 [Streptomyces tendae]
MKYSIERVRKINADTEVASILSTVDTVETKGDREVIFHLNTADATFPFKLSTPVAGIVNPNDYEKDKLRDGFELTGSGPYTMKAEVKGDQMTKAVFTKNPTYKGSLKVNNDKVELVSFADAEAMGDAIDKGDIDVMTRAMTPEQIQSLSKATDGDVDLVEVAGLEIRYLAFNTDASTVKDKAVRTAMAQVINRSELVSAVYGSQAPTALSRVNQRSTSRSASVSHRASRSPCGSSANSSPTSGLLSRSRSHWPGTSAFALGGVRSAAGASKSRSSTACTRVPLVAASLGFSGSRSMTRNRYRSGHCMKSPAREGESEVGGIDTGAGEGAAAVGSAAGAAAGVADSTAASARSTPVAAGRAGPPVSSATSSVLVSMSTDLTAGH